MQIQSNQQEKVFIYIEDCLEECLDANEDVYI